MPLRSARVLSVLLLRYFTHTWTTAVHNVNVTTMHMRQVKDMICIYRMHRSSELFLFVLSLSKPTHSEYKLLWNTGTDKKILILDTTRNFAWYLRVMVWVLVLAHTWYKYNLNLRWVREDVESEVERARLCLPLVRFNLLILITRSTPLPVLPTLRYTKYVANPWQKRHRLEPWPC